MFPRFYLFLLVGVLPLSAQSSVDNSDKLLHDNAPTVAPTPAPGAAMLQPGVTALPPGLPPVLPMMPAEPVVQSKLAEFTITPGTVREGVMYKEEVRSTIKLTAPATKDFVCHIVSSDPLKVVSDNIVFYRGHMVGTGAIKVYWIKVPHDGQVRFKAYDADNPEIVLQGRIYLRKKIE